MRNFEKENQEQLLNFCDNVRLLRRRAGLTQKEISNILEISPKNVEGRIYRGKKRLKAYLKEGGFEFE